MSCGAVSLVLAAKGAGDYPCSLRETLGSRDACEREECTESAEQRRLVLRQTHAILGRRGQREGDAAGTGRVRPTQVCGSSTWNVFAVGPSATKLVPLTLVDPSTPEIRTVSPAWKLLSSPASSWPVVMVATFPLIETPLIGKSGW